MIAYHDTVGSGTRIKNKIKAKFRANGMRCARDTIYDKAYREEWRNKLPNDSALLMIIDNLWFQLDQITETEKRILAAAKIQARQFPEIKRFQAVPRVGFITAATISTIIETP